MQENENEVAGSVAQTKQSSSKSNGFMISNLVGGGDEVSSEISIEESKVKVDGADSKPHIQMALLQNYQAFLARKLMAHSQHQQSQLFNQSLAMWRPQLSRYFSFHF